MPTFLRRTPIEQSSSFLSYWYDNSSSKGSLSHILDADAQTLIGPQYNNFLKSKQALFGNAAAGAAAGAANTEGAEAAANAVFAMGEFLDGTNQTFKDMMEPQDLDKQQTAAQEKTNSFYENLDNIHDAFVAINRIAQETEDVNQGIRELQQQVQNIVDALASDEYYQDAAATLWEAYCEECRQRKNGVNLKRKAAKDPSVYIEQLIKDILSKNGVFSKIGKDFDANSSDSRRIKMDQGLVKILLLAAKLPDFEGTQGDNFDFNKIKQALVKSSYWEKDKTVRNILKIFEYLATKIHHAAINVYGKAGEMAAAIGFLEAHVLDGHFEEFMKLSMETDFDVGNQTFNIRKEVIEQADKSFIEDLKQMKQGLQKLQQVSKADVGIKIMSRGKVVGNIGFSVKNSGKKLNDPTSTGSAKIQLQSNTPLWTLINLYMNLTPEQILDLQHIAASHGRTGNNATTEKELNKMWDTAKKQMAQLAFVDTLTGLTEEGRAYYMIAGQTLVSMDKIIEEVMYGNNISVEKVQKASKDSLSLERSTFLEANSWKENDGDPPNVEKGHERGFAAYSDVVQKMQDAKIKIMLNIKDIAAFRDMGAIS